jgi:hypothetical protein
MSLKLRTTLLCSLIVSAGAATSGATGIVDTFESYPLGTFPGPAWSDVATFDPQAPIGTLPSAFVVQTTDAFGGPTQALAVRDENALVAGIYAPVPVSSTYSLAADLRVDRFSNDSPDPAADWAMQLTFAQLQSNFYATPQAGIYASSLTGGWRLFLIDSTHTVFADEDLGLAVTLGRWSRVAFDLDALTGGWHVTIGDVASGTTLLDKSGIFSNWTTSSGLFDSVAFFDGDPDGTVANLAYVDNINVTSTPVPEPATLSLLLLSGLLGAGRRLRRGL